MKCREYITANSHTYSKLKETILLNRKNSTETENLVWQSLRNRKLGYKFRRQHLIHRYIVDFVCLEKMLIIEIDGGYHNNKHQQEYDHNRNVELISLGYSIVRFSNEQVVKDLNAVIEIIKSQLS